MEKVRRKKMHVREKVGKSRFTVFFHWFGAPESQKSNLAKAAGAEPAGQMRDEKLHAVVARSTFPSRKCQNNTPASDHFWKLRCRKSARRCDHFWKLRCRKSARCCGAKHISKSKVSEHASFGPLLEVEMSKKCMELWREAHFQVKSVRARQLRTTFGSWDVEKVHGVVARSTFPSQNGKTAPASDHFLTSRCRKSARLCCAKHISKSKVSKHTSFGPLLEVEMSKKCMELWREAHFQVKSVRARQLRTTFWRPDVEKVRAAAARNTCPSQKCQSTPASDHFWKLRCR